jgi:8-oxo-dGTP pyrophosphatase MutT (NUDIX family)
MDRNLILPLIEAFDDPADGSAAKSRELILHLLEHTPAPFQRDQFAPGHITCTGLVLSPALDSILFVHHARLDRWLLPGGHVEPEDESPFDAARREVVEETAAELDPGFAPFLAGMDVHGIPPKRSEPYHLHHDLIVAFKAQTRAVARSEESHAVEWLAIEQFEQRSVPESVFLSLRRALRFQCR